MLVGIRKLVFGILVVFWNDYPFINLIVFIIWNFVTIGIIFKYKPYKDCFLNYLNIFYELSYAFTYICSIP